MSGSLTVGGVLLSATFVFIGLLVILTNVCSLSIIRRQNDIFGDVSRLIYKRTAIVDLIGGLSGCVFYSMFVVRNTWPFNDEWSCRTLNTILYGAMFQSMIYLTLINIDRYIAIIRPLRYHSIVTYRSVQTALGLSLIPTAGFVVTSLVPQTPLYRLLGPTCTLTRNETLIIDTTDRTALSALFVLIMAPIFTGMALNFGSMMISLRHARAVGVAASTAAAPSSDPERRRPNILACKGVRTILLISAVNILAWTPAIVRFNYTLSTGSQLPAWLDVTLAILTLVNFWSNAPIFARTNAAYRTHGKALIKSLLCRESKAIPLRTSNDRDNEIGLK